MAKRAASQNLIKKGPSFPLSRLLNSANSSIPAVPPLRFPDRLGRIPAKKQPTIATPIPTNSPNTPTNAPKEIINLEDHKALFSSFSTSKLIRSSLVLQMVAYERMVDVGKWVINSGILETPILKHPVLKITEQTVYEHFCSGKNLKEVARTVQRLSDAGLTAMLDYGSEHAVSNANCDSNLQQFIETIDYAKALPASSVSFVVVKITAICLPELLARVSDLLRWEYKDPSLKLPWKLKTLPIFADSSPLYHTTTRPSPLSLDDERELQVAHQRLQKICEKCLEADIPLLIDAEDTSIQPAIDYFTYSAAIMYHKDDNPLVFGTIQAYLKDAMDRLTRAKKAADKMGIPVGFKLVRGAYMAKERQSAAVAGYKSPIQDTIEETHASYDACSSFMLEEIANGSGAVVLASHNVRSGRLAAAKAIDLGIKDSQKLQFAQLYGMADPLSFGLKNQGFHVSKYLPFGPVQKVLPYLLRRAEENRGLLFAATLDRQLMWKELKRRLKTGILQ